MAYYVVDGDDLNDIADAIRTKTGGEAPLEFPDDFVSGVSGIKATIKTSIK